jgi:hypothetical protein
VVVVVGGGGVVVTGPRVVVLRGGNVTGATVVEGEAIDTRVVVGERVTTRVVVVVGPESDTGNAAHEPSTTTSTPNIAKSPRAGRDARDVWDIGNLNM